jgi:hypothetical protein
MKQTFERAQKACEVLNKAVLECLNRKRLLGQYAIMEKDGKPAKVPADQLPKSASR